MVNINGTYSIGVEHKEDGSCVYQLLDGCDEVVFEKEAGTAYTSSVESMIELGKPMLDEFFSDLKGFIGLA